jgi:hypothetical protein
VCGVLHSLHQCAWISPGVKWLEREVKVKNVSALRHLRHLHVGKAE